MYIAIIISENLLLNTLLSEVNIVLSLIYNTIAIYFIMLII